ncbi:MAG: hypothetical protein K9M57_00765, partial [Phycisphaerae bacterium]|nr:hypothetical protein [Phycisphaerae bacterium]
MHPRRALIFLYSSGGQGDFASPALYRTPPHLSAPTSFPQPAYLSANEISTESLLTYPVHSG